MRSEPKTDYLYRRAGSRNWYARLKNPITGKTAEWSLGTPDKDAARAKARQDIAQHEALIYQRRQVRVPHIVHGPWTSAHFSHC